MIEPLYNIFIDQLCTGLFSFCEKSSIDVCAVSLNERMNVMKYAKSK